MPDLDVNTGEEIGSEQQSATPSAIETSTPDDMNAYAVTLNNGGAAHVLEVLEPTPVNAEEDSGSIALF